MVAGQGNLLSINVINYVLFYYVSLRSLALLRSLGQYALVLLNKLKYVDEYIKDEFSLKVFPLTFILNKSPQICIF